MKCNLFSPGRLGCLYSKENWGRFHYQAYINSIDLDLHDFSTAVSFIHRSLLDSMLQMLY